MLIYTYIHITHYIKCRKAPYNLRKLKTHRSPLVHISVTRVCSRTPQCVQCNICSVRSLLWATYATQSMSSCLRDEDRAARLLHSGRRVQVMWEATVGAAERERKGSERQLRVTLEAQRGPTRFSSRVDQTGGSWRRMSAQAASYTRVEKGLFAWMKAARTRTLHQSLHSENGKIKVCLVC